MEAALEVIQALDDQKLIQASDLTLEYLRGKVDQKKVVETS